MSNSSPKSRARGAKLVVEIGNDWLKVAQVDRSHSHPAVSKLFLEQVDPAGVDVSKVMAKAWRTLKLPSSPVIACLPRQAVNVRMLELPSTDPQEIVDMVDLQAAKQTPYSADEIVSDFRVGGGVRAGYTRVLLAIAQRSVLRQRFYVLDEAGIDVERMSVSSEGLLGWYKHTADAGPSSVTTAILDVDSSYSDFAVIAHNELVFTKSIMVGASQLLGDYGKWCDKLIREVQQACAIMQGENPGMAVGRVFLTGAGPNVKGLDVELGRQLNLAVKAVESASVAKMHSGTPSLKDGPCRAVSITSLLGAALAAEELELDLIPDTVRSKKEVLRKARRLTTFGMLLLAALVSLSLSATTTFFFKKSRLNELRAELGRTQPAVRLLEQRKKVIERVDQRDDSRLMTVSILSAVHELTADVYLDVFDCDAEKNQVSIEGTARAMKDVSGLVQKLEQSAYFSDVREGKQTVVDAKGRVRFQIVCGLEKRP